MQATRTIDLNRFKNVVGLTTTSKAWGNSRKADLSTVLIKGAPSPVDNLRFNLGTDTKADDKKGTVDKSRFRLSKQLIQCDEYEAIKSAFGALTTWVYSRTVPSFFKRGFQLASVGAVAEIEEELNAFASVRLPMLVQELANVYPDKVEEARAALGDQFRAADYPTAEELPGLFSLEWYWIAFTTPEALPPELRQQEEDKLKKKFEDAGDQIIEALRVSFLELIEHATDKLTVADGEKPKVFRDSLIGNIQDFISTFSFRNLMNDSELAGLVEKAKTVLVGAEPDKLRKDQDTRAAIAAKFAEIKANLDGMITTRKGRNFDFSE